MNRFLNLSPGKLASLGVGSLLLGTGGYLLNESMYTVDGGERALIFDRSRGGTKQGLKYPGTHFCIPFIQYPIIYDARIQPYICRSETGSKDLQRVAMSVRVLYKPVEEEIAAIYQRLGLDYAPRVFQSVGHEVMKSVVAQHDATELIARREAVSAEIAARLTERANSFGIQIVDVAMTHLTFSQEFLRAIEQKQVEQQMAERAKFLVEKEMEEKKAKVIKSRGEARAAELISMGTRAGPGYLTLRRIEAARDIALELSRSRNVTYLPGGENVLLSVNPNTP